MNSSCPHTRLQEIQRHLQPCATKGRHYEHQQVKTKPVRVTVTGAAGSIGYSLIHMIGQGRLLGPNQPISLTLLELPLAQQQLEGAIMELRDCSFPLITDVKGTTEYKDGFKDCEIAILVGARPRTATMERKDLLGLNALIFRDQGKALNEFADKNVKVLVVGNPANTNALICSHFAPSIPKANFTALTRLDQNRAQALLSSKLNVPVHAISNVIIWGNHSGTQYPDMNQATVEVQQGYVQSARGVLADDQWIQKDFIGLVAKRGTAIIEKRKASSAASAANAICDHIHDWVVGTQPGQFASVALMTDGKTYGVPADICFSFPTTSQDGKLKIFEGVKWDTFSQQMIEKTTKELLEEREMAFAYLKAQT